MNNHIDMSQENHVLKVQLRSMAFYIEELEKANIVFQNKIGELQQKIDEIEKKRQERKDRGNK